MWGKYGTVMEMSPVSKQVKWIFNDLLIYINSVENVWLEITVYTWV